MPYNNVPIFFSFPGYSYNPVATLKSVCLRCRIWQWYNDVTSVSIFIGFWPWTIKGHTYRWRQIHVRSRQQTCFSFFMPQKSFNKPFKFLLYTTNRLHFPACVYCNRPQKTSQHVNNNSHTTRRRLVSCVLSCSLHAVTSYVIYYSTHTEKCYLFVNFTKSSSSPSQKLIGFLFTWITVVRHFANPNRTSKICNCDL